MWPGNQFQFLLCNNRTIKMFTKIFIKKIFFTKDSLKIKSISGISFEATFFVEIFDKNVSLVILPELSISLKDCLLSKIFSKMYFLSHA